MGLVSRLRIQSLVEKAFKNGEITEDDPEPFMEMIELLNKKKVKKVKPNKKRSRETPFWVKGKRGLD
jgi:ribosome recycling factor